MVDFEYEVTEGTKVPENNDDAFWVKELKDAGTKGLDLASKLLGYSKDAITEIDKSLFSAKENIKQIQLKSTAIQVEKFNFTRKIFHEFNSARIELLSARQDLLSLAFETDHACENLEILFQYWDDTTPVMIQQQFTFLKRLMDKSKTVLKTAQEKYNSLLDIWAEIGSDISDFKDKIKEMTEEESETYKKWTKELREKAYLHVLVPVTVGMVVADVFGCLGFCSGVITTGSWTVSVATVETKIAEYKAELQALQEQTKLAVKDLDTLDDASENAIGILSTELELINNWSMAVERVEKSMAIFTPDQLKEYAAYKDKFIIGISKLRKSAGNFIKSADSNVAKLKLDQIL